MKNWQLSDIPDLSGKCAIITGANVGLGFRSALELSAKGAHVVIACRRPDSGQEAIERIHKVNPTAKPTFIPLDLTDPASIEAFCQTYRESFKRLDILLNNAGVVNLEELRHTAQGHEMHMATNHYGHFALTVRFFDLLCATPNARVVTVSSGAYRAGEIRFDDMDWRQRNYSRVGAYGDSKLANMLFMRRLQQHFDEKGVAALSLAAHPGLTGTERQQSIGIGGKLSKFLASSVAVGVAPQLRAATDPTAQKYDFYGPKFGIRGPACHATIKGKALDDELAEQLWKHSEAVTGCVL